MIDNLKKDILNNLSFHLSTLMYMQNILSNIHSDMLRIARKTIRMRITKPEQDSNLHLPITGRLFYQLNYPIFSQALNKTTCRFNKKNSTCTAGQ